MNSETWLSVMCPRVTGAGEAGMWGAPWGGGQGRLSKAEVSLRPEGREGQSWRIGETYQGRGGQDLQNIPGLWDATEEGVAKQGGGEFGEQRGCWPARPWSEGVKISVRKVENV